MPILDVVLACLLVAAATGYLTWKLVLRQARKKSSPVVVGNTLAKAMAGTKRHTQRG